MNAASAPMRPNLEMETSGRDERSAAWKCHQGLPLSRASARDLCAFLTGKMPENHGPAAKTRRKIDRGAQKCEAETDECDVEGTHSFAGGKNDGLR